MTIATKAKQLEARISDLESVLVAVPTTAAAKPLALKVEEGDDRVHGYTD